jgi:hypothetical protein
MCTVTNGTPILCLWAMERRGRRAAMRLLLTQPELSMEDAARALTAGGGHRVYARDVRAVRRVARRQGCLPEEGQVATPEPGETLPPPPRILRGYLLGTPYLAPFPPSTVDIPARLVAEPVQAKTPLKRSPLDPWSRPVNPMEAA